jgi:MFS family permease
VQGVGAGTITAAVFAAVPLLFNPAAAARLVGLFSGVYGLASIVGPLLGGVISDGVGWRGVFWINVPIALVAITLVMLTYPLDSQTDTVTEVDYAGAATLVGGMSPVLLALLVGGRDIPWDSPLMAALLAVGFGLLAAFVWIERRAAEPIIPLRDLAQRALGAPVLGSALMNGGLIATLLFTPLFVQGVIGRSATQSGGLLAPMLAVWVIASIVSGQIVARLGRTRPVGVVGMAFAAAGLYLIASMGPDTEYAVVTRNLVLVGAGFGTALPAFIIAAQNALPVERAGVALGLSTFARAIGATLASAALGALLTASVGASASSASVQNPLMLSEALSRVFLVAAGCVALGVGVAWLIPERPR